MNGHWSRSPGVLLPETFAAPDALEDLSPLVVQGEIQPLRLPVFGHPKPAGPNADPFQMRWLTIAV